MGTAGTTPVTAAIRRAVRAGGTVGSGGGDGRAVLRSPAADNTPAAAGLERDARDNALTANSTRPQLLDESAPFGSRIRVIRRHSVLTLVYQFYYSFFVFFL